MVKLKTLVNQKRWQEIRDLYPALVKRTVSAAASSHLDGTGDKENSGGGGCCDGGSSQEEAEYERDCDQIMRDFAKPGEIKAEFEQLIAREEEMRRRQREKEEEMSLTLIRTKFSEDTERITRQRKMEQDDEALARALQHQMDQEELEAKQAEVLATRRRSRRGHSSPVADAPPAQCKRPRPSSSLSSPLPQPVTEQSAGQDSSTMDLSQDTSFSPVLIRSEHNYSKAKTELNPSATAQ